MAKITSSLPLRDQISLQLLTAMTTGAIPADPHGAVDAAYVMADALLKTARETWRAARDAESTKNANATPMTRHPERDGDVLHS